MYTAISSGRDEDNTPLSRREKNDVATTYAIRDPRRRVSEIETSKIASTVHAGDSILVIFYDGLKSFAC